MKHILTVLFAAFFIAGCSHHHTTQAICLRDGFYQVNATGLDSSDFKTLTPNEIIVPYNSIYNEQEFTMLVLDTSDFVPLELEQLPVAQKDSSQRMQLSITLSKEASRKISRFTAQRVMKSVAIVLDGEAITMHRIKDTIKGGQMVISWCGENACRQLYTKIKDNVKK